jgi:fatty acid desaturase
MPNTPMSSTMTTGAAHHPQRTAKRMPASELLTPQQLAQVRERSPWRGALMVAHAWATILAAVALVIVWPNPLTLLAAIIIIGSRQLGLAILMHDGAHGALHPDETTNLRLSQWFCAYPILAETRAYRRYHLKHHAHTQTDQDPDLILSRPFPITSASYRRKFIRDITGQTGFEQRKAQLLNALGAVDRPWSQRLQSLWAGLGPQLSTNIVIAALFTLVVGWWGYPVLWIVPNLTWNMVVTRVRNIAEHAVVPDSTDPLRNTRTTIANRFERLTLAPYYVNYHLEHHLFFYVPAYNLPNIHGWLMAGPHRDRMEVQQGYWGVLAKATARPVAEDKPGEIVNAARRARAGSDANNDRAKAGF